MWCDLILEWHDYGFLALVLVHRWMSRRLDV